MAAMYRIVTLCYFCKWYFATNTNTDTDTNTAAPAPMSVSKVAPGERAAFVLALDHNLGHTCKVDAERGDYLITVQIDCVIVYSVMYIEMQSKFM